jgi:hypothetical protein
MKFFALLLIVLSTQLFANETYFTSFHPLQDSTCKKYPQPKGVLVKLFQDTIDFEFEEIGFIEIHCDASLDKEEVIQQLQYVAWKNCSDAIIDVAEGNAVRNRKTKYYGASNEHQVYSALAVRIKNPKQGLIPNNYDFLNVAKNKNRAKGENSASAAFFAGVGATIGAIVFILAGINLDEQDVD